MSDSAEKCKRGDPLGFINIHSVAKYRKIRRGNLSRDLKIFGKSRTVPKKIERGDLLVSSGFVGYLKKVNKTGTSNVGAISKLKKRKVFKIVKGGDPFSFLKIQFVAKYQKN